MCSLCHQLKLVNASLAVPGQPHTFFLLKNQTANSEKCIKNNWAGPILNYLNMRAIPHLLSLARNCLDEAKIKQSLSLKRCQTSHMAHISTMRASLWSAGGKKLFKMHPHPQKKKTWTRHICYQEILRPAADVQFNWYDPLAPSDVAFVHCVQHQRRMLPSSFAWACRDFHTGFMVDLEAGSVFRLSLGWVVALLAEERECLHKGTKDESHTCLFCNISFVSYTPRTISHLFCPITYSMLLHFSWCSGEVESRLFKGYTFENTSYV